MVIDSDLDQSNIVVYSQFGYTEIDWITDYYENTAILTIILSKPCHEHNHAGVNYSLSFVFHNVVSSSIQNMITQFMFHIISIENHSVGIQAMPYKWKYWRQ